MFKGRVERAASRGIAAAGGGDGGGGDQACGFLCYPALPGSVIGGTAALRPCHLRLPLSPVRSFPPAWRCMAGGRRAARRSVDYPREAPPPKDEWHRLAFDRMRFDDASLQQFEAWRQRITR